MEARLPVYEAARKPIVEKIIAAAGERRLVREFAWHMAMAPMEFAMSYIQRSGRVDIERLRSISPGFAARYGRERPATTG